MTVVKIAKKALGKTHEFGFKRKKMSRPDLTQVPRQSERWKLSKHGLRQSTIHLWLRCREQFRLQVVEGWRGFRTSAAIDNGNLWHWLLDRRHNHGQEFADSILKRYYGDFRDQNPNCPNKRLTDLNLSLLQASVMWPIYCKKYPDKFEWLGVEKEFGFHYRCPLWPKYQIPLRGVFDGVYRDDKGKIWLFETKTKSIIDEFEIQDGMALDFQVMLYLFAVKQLWGKYPSGVLYNVIRKPIVRKFDSNDEYRKKLTKDIAKRPDHFYKRWKMTIKPEEIDSWVRQQLDSVLLDIARWSEGEAPHYVNSRNLTTKYGRCEMFDVITANDYSSVFRSKVLDPTLMR